MWAGSAPTPVVPTAPFQTVGMDNHEATVFGEDVHTHPVTQRKDESRTPVTPKLALDEKRKEQIAGRAGLLARWRRQMRG